MNGEKIEEEIQTLLKDIANMAETLENESPIGNILVKLFFDRRGDTDKKAFICAVAVLKHQMIEQYQKATILIQPSLFEGHSLTVLEAMANKLPVVAFNYPGIDSDFIHNEHIVIVQKGDWEQLAKEIIFLLKASDKREYLVKAALEKVKEFDWNIQVEKWQKIF